MKELTLHQERQNYRPVVPKQLQAIEKIQFISCGCKETHQEVAQAFPLTQTDHILTTIFGAQPFLKKPLKVAVVLSGGPAPGGHAVIAAIYELLQEIHSQSELFGVLNGPQGLIEESLKKLSHDEVKLFQNQGGFDLIGSSRTKIERESDFQAAINTVKKYELDGLIIIGGDDSNTNAALLAERFLQEGLKTTVVGVPKTIDGDLQNEYLPISFGFDTACGVYSELIGNIMKDMLSAKKYYFFIRLMGRAASHITLECALRTHPNLAFISEELQAKGSRLRDVVDEIVDMVIERKKLSKQYGVILIPEGLIEHLQDVQALLQQQPHASQALLEQFPEDMRRRLLQERDSHGNIPVSQIETERLLIQLVQKRLAELDSTSATWFTAHPVFYGYEGRCAYPTNFDITFSSALGRIAGLLVAHQKTGYLASCQNLLMNPHYWQPVAIPLSTLLQYEVRNGIRKPVIAKALVELDGRAFQAFANLRSDMRLNDGYKSPGPLQFYGPTALSWHVPYIVERDLKRE